MTPYGKATINPNPVEVESADDDQNAGTIVDRFRDSFKDRPTPSKELLPLPACGSACRPILRGAYQPRLSHLDFAS
jgi:hypothetical protein